MGKGGYFGGGTIIGPHTPGWFGKPRRKKRKKADGKQEQQAAGASSNAAGGSGKVRATNPPRRKPPRPAHPIIALPKRELSTADERRIAKLRLHIKGLEQLRDSYQKQIDSSLAELNGVLKEYGLPLERPGKP